MSVMYIRDKDGNLVPVKSIQGSPGDPGGPGGKGDPGVGIVSIEQTVISEENGGTNVFAITLTDGTRAEIEIRNGGIGTVAIAGGGTGATDAASARSNLGVAPAPIVSQTDITAGSAASSGRPYHVIE